MGYTKIFGIVLDATKSDIYYCLEFHSKFFLNHIFTKNWKKNKINNIKHAHGNIWKNISLHFVVHFRIIEILEVVVKCILMKRSWSKEMQNWISERTAM